MPIITISRGSFSGGKMLAETVAQELGYRCVDREQIIEKAAIWSVSQSDLRTAIERPPSFLGQSQHAKYIYLAFIQAARLGAGGGFSTRRRISVRSDRACQIIFGVAASPRGSATGR